MIHRNARYFLDGMIVHGDTATSQISLARLLFTKAIMRFYSSGNQHWLVVRRTSYRIVPYSMNENVGHGEKIISCISLVRLLFKEAIVRFYSSAVSMAC